MKKAIIITASQGLGLKLKNTSLKFEIESQTHVVSQPGIGERNDLEFIKTDYVMDINNPVIMQTPEINFDYLIWCTGVFLQKSFAETTDYELDTLIDLHYRVPLRLIRHLHQQKNTPYHLIVIASCSSWRLRHEEAIYCGLSAAKAAFTRNFANDLVQLLPGSKVTLLNPGGLRTPFFYEDDTQSIDDSYIDQDKLASFIWQTATEQEKPFQEIQFLRNKSVATAEPIIEFASRCPETIT